MGSMSMLDSSRVQAPFELEDQATLDPLYYYEILKKRKFYGLIPLLCVLVIGWPVVMLLPPAYLSEGRILVESQQIPIDLVRPTVTATASERIATIQQRVMTRDNLLKIVDKHQMFADQRGKLSRTDMLDLMRANTVVRAVDIDPALQRNQNVTIAITVGFTDRRPDVATRVANELITLFLNEDARNRTNRATETTKFLAQEVEKLKAELASIDERIIEARRRNPASEALPQLTLLRAELAQKAAVFSQTHPEVKRLKAQIEALEKAPAAVSQAPATLGGYTAGQFLDPLLLQRVSVQTNLENTNQKLAAAQRGENLERDQFSERLEVLEQAVPPQKPIKPNRQKLLAFTFAAAIMAGFAGILAIETIDKTIRTSSDLMTVSNGQLIVSIPYIVTKAELHNKKNKMIFVIGALILVFLVGLIAIHFLWRPLDELWLILQARFGF
jgi:protein tyrosine kinase modulator